MTNIITFVPRQNAAPSSVSKPQSGDNVVPFKRTVTEAEEDNRPDTAITNIILASASNALERLAAEQVVRTIVLEAHKQGLKVMQLDVRLVSAKETEPKLYAVLYTLKGDKDKVLELEVSINQSA